MLNINEDEIVIDISDQAPLLDVDKSNLNIENASSKPPSCLYCMDVIFSVLIVSPLSAVYWVTLWNVLDENVIIHTKVITNIVYYSIGFGVLLVLNLLQNYLQQTHAYLRNLKYFSKILSFLMRSIYMYLVCGSGVLEWLAIWNILDTYLLDWKIKLCLSIISLTYLCLTRSTRNLAAAPYLLLVDAGENFFEYQYKSVKKIL